MIDFYNAFISYKHAPLDIKVAEHVQKNLEHFHIPGKIQKKTGKKRIERIFRDKDELPITSDLTDTISNALEKADYLIVICSPNTKQSMWVKREIQFFLKNHTRDRILTVLAEGEPQDVIPDELKYDERLVTNELGAQYTVKIPIEPLSCDYRMPFKKALKEELPRLAAAIIGCSYDELVRRQRMYKMRRLSIIFSLLLVAAIGFAGYMFYSKSKIDQAYKDAMASQSRFLANESANLLENEQRIKALYLAVAALPKDENDSRPVTAEAVSALTNATMAYRSLEGVSIHSTWNYTMGNTLKYFCLSPDTSAIAAYDISGNIKAWSTADHELLLDITNQSSAPNGMSFISEDKLVVWYSDRAVLYSMEDGDDIWTLDSGDTSFIHKVIMIPDDSHIIMATNKPSLYLINTNSGEIEQTYSLDTRIGSEQFVYNSYKLSPDGSKVAFSAFITAYAYIGGIYDLRSGRTTLITDFEGSVSDFYWADDSHVLYAVNDISQMTSAVMDGNEYLCEDTFEIFCYNPSNGSRIWNTEVHSTGSLLCGFLESESTESVSFSSGNKCIYINVSNGNKVHEWSITDQIVDISDRDGDGMPLMITDGGAIAMPLSSSEYDAVSVSDTLADNLVSVTVQEGVYAVQKYGHEIIYYDTYVYDDDWTPYDSNLVLAGFLDHYVGDNVVAVISNEDEGKTLTMIDPNEEELICQTVLGSAYEYHILGADEDNLYIASSEVGETDLITVDISDGNTDTTKLNDLFCTLERAVVYQDGKIIYLSKDNRNNNCVSIYDPSTDRGDSFAFTEGNITLSAPLCYNGEGGYIYVAAEGDDYIVNVNEEEVSHVSLPRTWADTQRTMIDNERFVVSDGTSIIILNDEGRVQNTVANGGQYPLGFTFFRQKADSPEYLLVAYNDGSLDRYESENYSFVARSEFSAYQNYNSLVDFRFDTDNGILYIQQLRLTSIIDLESWVELAYINSSFGYHAPTDRFVTASYKTTHQVGIGYFRHYTLEELMDKANKILQGSEMPEEMRSQYGL